MGNGQVQEAFKLQRSTLAASRRRKIAAEITDTPERIAHKPKSYTYIAFDELLDES